LIRRASQRERDAWAHWRLTPEELDHYGIRDAPERDRDYLSFEAWSKVVRRPLADKHTVTLLDNKWIFAHYYHAVGIDLPETYGLLHPLQGATKEGEPLTTMQQLVGWLRHSGTREFVMKPLVGWNSEGVIVVVDTKWDDSGTAPSFKAADGAMLSAVELDERLLMSFRGATGCLVQERCQPHSSLVEAGLSMANAARIVTFVNGAGGVEVQTAALFVGRAGRMVNSWTEGALSISIDTQTGVLGHGRTLPKYGTEPLESHPDTGIRFRGRRLPDWEDAVDLATSAARSTPNLRLVCWEILLTDRGPRLLEGNLGFGLTLLQVHTDGFLRDGTARKWADAGADLPDGTRRWGRAPLSARARRRVARAIRKVR
jgi:hypothetical protein